MVVSSKNVTYLNLRSDQPFKNESKEILGLVVVKTRLSYIFLFVCTSIGEALRHR